MSKQIAHNIDEKQRTDDIKIQENVDFTAMLLSDKVLQGLKASGFKKPSPIQLKAIPMGRFGYDLVIKAKSGTGKTAVFGIIALEMVDVTKNTLQVLVLAPTREIAVQIKEVILSIGSAIEGLNVNYFIGGTSVEEDAKRIKTCHIAVAAPGRMEHLIRGKRVNLKNVRLFVLDEADQLCTNPSIKNDVKKIYGKLSEGKQMITTSATYPNELEKFLAKFMSSPVHISQECEIPFLLGLKQFVSVVHSHLNVLQQMNLKTEELLRILTHTQFTQCMIFSNYQTRAESLSNNLQKLGWPTTYISAAQTQQKRLQTYTELKEFKCRILVTTDLTARGIDAANVDLVINIDVPHNPEIYLHRMGRAGRYGSRGLCITIAAEGAETDKLHSILEKITGTSYSVPLYPAKSPNITDVWDCNTSDLEQFCATRKSGISSETVCAELKDLSVKEKHEQLSENALDKTIQLLKTSAQTNINQFTNCIDSLLENINTEDEVQKITLKNKLPTLDANFSQNLMKPCTSITAQESITNSIEHFPKSSEKKKNVIKKSQKKKIKSNLLTTDTKSKATSCSNDKSNTNMQFDSQAKLFQENIYNKNETFNKNMSLYNITKYLARENVPSRDCEISVDKLLGILNDEDNLKMNYLKDKMKTIPLDSISKFLIGKNDFDENCQSDIDKLLNQIDEEDNFQMSQLKKIHLSKTINQAVEEPISNNTEVKYEQTENICTCHGDIFVKAFDYASGRSEQSWENFICDVHESDCQNHVDLMHMENEEMDDYNNEENQEYINYDENEDYYEENEDYSGEYFETEENESRDVEIDDDIFVKAYDYAVARTENSVEMSVVAEEYYEDAVGYASDLSHPVTREVRKKRKRNETNDEKNYYETSFNYYANMLSENAPSFTSKEDFETYFSNWRRNVSSLRKIVFNRVYNQEMLRLQNESNT